MKRKKTWAVVYLGGAQVDVGRGGSRRSSWFVGAVSLVQDAPQQGDGRHDGVKDGQNSRTSFGQMLLVDTHL